MPAHACLNASGPVRPVSDATITLPPVRLPEHRQRRQRAVCHDLRRYTYDLASGAIASEILAAEQMDWMDLAFRQDGLDRLDQA
jgi:hypothetical protein